VVNVPDVRRGWLAVLAVALGLFLMVTTELLPVGLLTPVAASLDVSEGTAGLMVTAPGFVAAVAAPLIAGTAGRVDRRLLLAGLAAMLGLGNLTCAVAPHFGVVLVGRLVASGHLGGRTRRMRGLLAHPGSQAENAGSTPVIRSVP